MAKDWQIILPSGHTELVMVNLIEANQTSLLFANSMSASWGWSLKNNLFSFIFNFFFTSSSHFRRSSNAEMKNEIQFGTDRGRWIYFPLGLKIGFFSFFLFHSPNSCTSRQKKQQNSKNNISLKNNYFKCSPMANLINILRL